MAYDLPVELEGLGLLLAVAGVPVGIGLGGLVAVAPATRRWPEMTMGVLTLLSAAILLAFAGARDTYYDDATSHWEHGGMGGQAWTVVALVSTAAALALFLAARRAPPLRTLRATALLVAGLSCGFDAVAVFALSIGH
jgi:hypothetical protein